jgi:hypothetical protein
LFCLLTGSAVGPAAGCGVVANSDNGGSGDGSPQGDDGAEGDGGGSATGDASSCHPGSVQTYVPDMYHSAAAANQGVCSPDQIMEFYNDCLGPSVDAGACHALSQPDAADAACVACILTPDTADHYGPLIDHATFITENVAGCIEVTDASGLSCAKAEAALAGCELAACEASCPVVDMKTRAAYDACANQADNSGCQAYATMAACTSDAGASDAGASMCSFPTFEAFYRNVVPRFCGTPSGDSGASPYDALPEVAATPDGAAESGP